MPGSLGVRTAPARLPQRRLAPADLRKDAGAFDLPIALGLLVSTRQLAFLDTEVPLTVRGPSCC
jgi:predicted ATPase with chaperone activity